MHDLVTSLREDRNGYRITVNDSIVFRLTASDYRSFPLAEGQDLDWEAYSHNLVIHQAPDALNRAVGFLAAHAHSRREVERKLMDRGYLPDTVEWVLYKLEKEKLLDDEAFARAWVQARSARQLGKARILQELRLKGVSESTAKAALVSLDADEMDSQALALAVKLLAHHANEPAPEAMRKSVAAMLRRGFGYGEASRALRAAIEREGID